MVETALIRERWNRIHSPRQPRHLGAEKDENFTATFTTLGKLGYEGAQVSANVIDLRTGRVLVSIDDRVVMPTASIGKILLLIEVSARLTERDFSGYGILDKTPRDAVGDSGIWQHLQAPALPVSDLATIVGATSDNLATNVLLRQVGLDAVRARTESLGLSRTALLDLVRDTRGPDDAPQLSVGSTVELAWLFGALARSEIVDPLTSQRVMGWLSLNADLSLVASAFGLDPLSHRGVDHSTLLVNKTGADAGVRSEAGALRGARSSVAYAVSVQFNDDGLAARLRVIDAMRTVGYDLLEYVH
ncbi:MAG TPA: serine hydrolase [Galbitalea sp.]